MYVVLKVKSNPVAYVFGILVVSLLPINSSKFLLPWNQDKKLNNNSLGN